MEVLLTEIKGPIGYITLNSEKSLNSLNLEMITSLRQTLLDWKNDDSIRCVFLQGAGEKAFCAGGDVRRLYDAMVAQKSSDATKVPTDCLAFFEAEYRTDYLIHTYPKPIVVWGHGIVMGGGIGLFAGASHRVVTERSKLAMPEITIGLYPDVGATFFLNNMASAYGLYLGMTGTRIDGADCLFLGLADYFLESTAKEKLKQRLEAEVSDGDASAIVSRILSEMAAGTPPSAAEAHEGFIRKFEGVKSVSEFGKILEENKDKDEWIAAGWKSFSAGSPSSAAVIFRQLEHGKNLSLKDVFVSELNLSSQCAIHPDFAEGVRALLVDKDLSPKWQPATASEITESWIDSYFAPIWADDKNPLNDL